MKEYRRFVAYVYEYQKGKKGRNCGFIRVEAREQDCSLEVHLLCPGLTPDAVCDIFGFVRNAGLIDGKRIGSCITEESRADCVLETERDNMGGSGISLEKIGGIILTTQNGAFFGTEWDDQPIRPENFRETKNQEKKEPEKKKADSVPENQEEAEPVPENQEELEPAPENQEGPEPVPENQEEPEPVPEEQEEPNREQPQREEAELEAQAAAEKEPVSVPQKAPAGEKAADMLLFSIGEPADAFSDGEIYDCRKVRLQDIGRWYPGERGLRNNRFLQYGFYNFGHLLLGKTRSGSYILGVPGGYDQQERFMANMFGFPYFRQSSLIRLPKVKGGYWYRLINAPKLY